MRERLIARVADEVLRARDQGVIRVGVDGVDGAGKTMFADELAITKITGMVWHGKRLWRVSGLRWRGLDRERLRGSAEVA